MPRTSSPSMAQPFSSVMNSGDAALQARINAVCGTYTRARRSLDKMSETLAPAEVADAIEKIDRVCAEELIAETTVELPRLRVIEPVERSDHCVLMSERQHARYVM